MGSVNFRNIQIYPLVGIRGFETINDDHYKRWYGQLPDVWFEYDEDEDSNLLLITKFYYNMPGMVDVKGVLFPITFDEFKRKKEMLNVSFDSMFLKFGIVNCLIRQGEIVSKRSPEGIEVKFSNKKYR